MEYALRRSIHRPAYSVGHPSAWDRRGTDGVDSHHHDLGWSAPAEALAALTAGRNDAATSPHLHFTPTSSSWLNLVERWFNELTERRLRRVRSPALPS